MRVCHGKNDEETFSDYPDNKMHDKKLPEKIINDEQMIFETSSGNLSDDEQSIEESLTSLRKRIFIGVLFLKSKSSLSDSTLNLIISKMSTIFNHFLSIILTRLESMKNKINKEITNNLLFDKLQNAQGSI